MITSSRKRFNEVYPYIMKDDRGSENPTVWYINLMSPERNAYYTGLFAECMQQKGFRDERFNSERFISVQTRRLCECVKQVDNVEYEDETGAVEPIPSLINDSEAAEKKFKQIFMGLDDDQRQELAEACTKYSFLMEGIKKK